MLIWSLRWKKYRNNQKILLGFHSGFKIRYTLGSLQRKTQMKLRIKPTPAVEMELQSTQEELRLLRRAIGRFTAKDMVRACMTDEEQVVFRKFHSDLFEIDMAVGK